MADSPQCSPGDNPFRVLLDLAKASREGLTDAPLHALVARRVAEALGARRAVLYWLTDGGARLEALASLGVSEAYTEVVSRHFRASIGGLSGSLGRPLVVSDIDADPRIAPPLREAAAREGLRSLLNLPLGHGGRLHGALTVYWNSALSDAAMPDLDTAQILCDQVTLLLVKGHALDEVADLAAERLRALEQASVSLASAVDELMQLDRLKGDFLSAVSHELRTPLTTILGFSEFLEEGVAGPLSDEQRRFVGQIAEATHQLSGLVDDLLDFARMEAGHFQVDCRPTDGAAIAREVGDGMAATAALNHLSLEVTVPRDLPWVMADPVRLRQILTNLVSNALKFTPAGGRVSIRASAEAETAEVHFEVEDTGLGIAPEHHRHIFQKFFRAGHTLTSATKGTGLGLAIVRQLVLAQRGSINFDSEPGRGSRFYFRLPQAQPGG